MTYVRPHLAIIAFAAFGIAVVLGRRRRSGVARGTSLGLRAMGVALLVVGFSFAISQASGLIPGFEPDGTVDLNETLTETQRRSSQGGSEIEVTAPNILPEYPLAFITVMFRPLPFEVTNFNALLAATESTVLIVLFVLWRRQVGDGVRRAFREPYLMMAGLYTLAFGLAWASVGNLGIIARQRVQVLPLLVLFLCVPALAGRRLRSNQQDALPQAAERAH